MTASRVKFTEEQPSTRNVEAAATAIAGFVGVTERGPLNEATFVTSIDEYRKIFGGYVSGGDVAQAVDGFFGTGGAQAYIVRVCKYTAGTPAALVATVNLNDGGGTPADVLKIDAKTPGAYGNTVSVTVAAATSGDAAYFDLKVSKGGALKETFTNLSMDPANDRHVDKIVNNAVFGSDLIKATALDVTAPYTRPVNVTGTLLTGGNDGLASIADVDYTGDAATKTGLFAFDRVFDVTMIAVPGRATAAVHVALLNYCSVTKGEMCFAVLDPPAGNSRAQIVTYVQSTAAIEGTSEFGAIYWPRIKVANPDKTVFGSGDTITVAPSGDVMGMFARNDARNDAGVFISPAGVEEGALTRIMGIETDEVLEQGARDIVTDHRINPITWLPGFGFFVDDTLTLKAGGLFPYIGQRRGVNFVKASLDQGLQFVRHKNNDEELRAEVRRTLDGFLLNLTREGAFASKDPSKAFYVDVSDALNPPSVQLAGKLRARVGLAVSTPARFVEIFITKDTRALDAELAAAAG